MLGYYHPKGPLDIPDPLYFTDPKGYDKCYWMLYKSIKNLIKLLKEEEEAEARRKPKIIKLADPTVFTITSPSAWLKQKLKSPDISIIEVREPIAPKNIVLVPLPDIHPSSPQSPPPEVKDEINYPQKCPKELPETIDHNVTIDLVFPAFEEFEDLDFQTCVDTVPSPPQPPAVEVDDVINPKSENPVNKSLNHLLPPVLIFYPLSVPNNESEYQPNLLQLSPPQPPSISIPDEPNKVVHNVKILTDKDIQSVPFSMLPQGICIDNPPSHRLSPPPPPNPTDDVTDKINKLMRLKKNFICDQILPPTTPQLPTTIVEPEQLTCNVRQHGSGRRPLHPRHVVTCSHLHLLLSCVFSMTPPPLDVDYLATPEPVRKGRGDIFDDVKHFRSFIR